MKDHPRVDADDIEKILGNISPKEIAEKSEEAKGIETPDELPILPIRESVLYPKMILPLMVSPGTPDQAHRRGPGQPTRWSGSGRDQQQREHGSEAGGSVRGGVLGLHPQNAQDAQQQHSPPHPGDRPDSADRIYPGRALHPGQGHRAAGSRGEDHGERRLSWWG